MKKIKPDHLEMPHLLKAAPPPLFLSAPFSLAPDNTLLLKAIQSCPEIQAELSLLGQPQLSLEHAWKGSLL